MSEPPDPTPPAEPARSHCDSPKAHRYAVGFALLLACCTFLPGINWGLPSRAADKFLFGAKEPWSGAKIIELAPRESGLGADVDANPILNRTQAQVLNDTDEERAEIVRRYRLFSHQPDEMITFKSLSRIKEFHGDPRLYQYGGLWIYPVGALIKVALNPKSGEGGQAYFLDRPEEFGKFYIVARLYSAAWGLVATWAVFWIVHRTTASSCLAAFGAMTFACMPVVVNMAHEAKPHLAGLSLTLLAVIAATKYVETGRDRWALFAGFLCGAAFGMVISSLLAFAVLPVMVVLRQQSFSRKLVVCVESASVGIATYAILNPFVLINLFTNRAVLESNLSNSTAMYHIDAGGLVNALRLVVLGASPVVAGAFALAIARLLIKTHPTPGQSAAPPRVSRAALILLAAPAALVALQFVLLATNKPAEYARFALVLDAFLLVTVYAAIGAVRSARFRRILAMGIFAFTVPFAVPYVFAFIRDASGNTSRLAAAERLSACMMTHEMTVELPAEPAPYCTPPVDLFRTKLILPPTGQSTFADVVVRMNTSLTRAPISWADVRFAIVPRRKPATAVSSPP